MTIPLASSIATRRTFAIIAHPDAGKTTLTEKLLLFGGAIQLAGAVRARGEQRRARSDWMRIERERGISVTASVMSFNYGDCVFNLVDTPGHEDFSEDTYRTLTAVDSAIMVLDAAKGIETQTRKLFEVCRLRNIPLLTFINKMDRESRDPLDLLGEIEKTLALDVVPMSWPIGQGQDFKGVWDIAHDRLILTARKQGPDADNATQYSGLDDPLLAKDLGAETAYKLREEVSMIQGLCPSFDAAIWREGHVTPIWFGSALTNFGVRELLQGLAEHAPAPMTRRAVTRDVQADEDNFSGFVFKVQANMDPAHRDRVAFVRICSGKFKRGAKIFHVRSGKLISVNNAVLFMARERALAEEAIAGDIIGIPNHGTLRVGDTLTAGEALNFTGIPAFAPELLRRARVEDPLRTKHLRRALEQLAEEGASRVFKPHIGADWIVGVVGTLQFDVLKVRLQEEYGLPVVFEDAGLDSARWVESSDAKELEKFRERNRGAMADDHDGNLVFLARNSWQLNKAVEDNPNITFLKTREMWAKE